MANSPMPSGHPEPLRRRAAQPAMGPGAVSSESDGTLLPESESLKDPAADEGQGETTGQAAVAPNSAASVHVDESSREFTPKPTKRSRFTAFRDAIHRAHQDHTSRAHAAMSNSPKPDTEMPADLKAELNRREQRTSVGELAGVVSKQASALVKGEINLAKAKAAASAKRFGVGIGLLVVVGILALYLIERLLRVVEFAFALIVPLWAAALITAAILLVIMIVLALIALKSINKGKTDIPAPQKGVAKDVDAIKEGLA